MTATMDHCFVYLPAEFNDALKYAVKTGQYANRSEAIREAVKKQLLDDIPFLISHAEDQGSLIAHNLKYLQKQLQKELVTK